MAKVTKEEVLKIAEISRLDIHENEIEAIVKQLTDVLNYAESVKEAAADVQEPKTKNVNEFREDVVVRTDAQEILAEAPEREEDFFVVPAILDDK